MRVGDKVWYCTKLSREIYGQSYSQPVEITTRLRHFTVINRAGSSDIIEMGQNASSYSRAVAQPYIKWKNTFKNGDLFYIDGASPNEDEDFYGQNANYVVDNVGHGNLVLELTLKRVVE